MSRIGYTKCGCCGQPEAAVSQTPTGTLSVSCHRCQFSGFAKRGTRAHRAISAALTPDEDAPKPEPAAPAAAPAPTAPTPPAPSSKPPKRVLSSSPFSMNV